MAFAAQDQNQVLPGQPAPVIGQTPIAAGGAGVAGASKAATAPGQNVPQQPSAQLSAYLAANQPQASQFAGQIASDLTGKVGAAGNAINPAINAYTSSIYNVPTNTEVNTAVEKSPAGLTPEQKTAYQAELGAAGKAPNASGTFETTQPYQDLTSNIQQTVEQANLWNSANSVPNLSAALTPYEKAAQTSGNTTLDALLLSQIPGAYGQIKNAVAPAAGLQGQLDTGTQAANTALRNAIAQDTAATQAAQSSAGKFVGGMNKQLADYLAKAQTDAATYNNAVNALSGQEANIQPQLGALENAVAAYNNMLAHPSSGIVPTSFKALTPLDIGNPLALPSTVGLPNIGALGTQQNYSDIAALQDLLGAQGLAGLNPSITPETANLAGSYISPATNIPMVGELYNPVTQPVGTGLDKNNPIINGSQFPSFVTNPYSNVQSAYSALLQALGQQTPTTPVNPVMTGASVGGGYSPI